MRWLSVAVIEFKITEEQFWELTPAKFFALLDQKNVRELKDDYRIGSLISLVHNALAKKAENWLNWFPEHKKTIDKIENKKEDRLEHKDAIQFKTKLRSLTFRAISEMNKKAKANGQK